MVKAIALKEYKEQMLLIEWADLHGLIPVHCPNGGTNPKRGWILKQMGVRPGFPDLTLYIANAKYHGLFLEMKQNRFYTASQKNTESWQRQQWWIDHLLSQGYYATFVYGWQHGAKIITDFLANKL